MNLKYLQEPFEEDELEHRIGQCGETNGKVWALALTYVSARAVQDRLDNVCGPHGWKVSYSTMTGEQLQPGIVAKISIKIGDEWVSKEDGADQSHEDPFKGGLSGAFKRAGSCWGAGRYLYKLEATFVDIVEKGTKGSKRGQTKDKKVFYWIPPKIPSWALPKKENKGATEGSFPDLSQKKFTIGQYSGKTYGEVLKTDSAQDYKYAKELHKKIAAGLTNFSPEYFGYHEFAANEGVFG